MAEEHRARVVIDGTTTGFARAADQGRTAAQRFEVAVNKNKDAVGKLGGSLKSAVPNLVALSGNAASATKSATGLASAIFAGAKAFGPWGLAIGFAGDALVSLVSSTDDAARASREFAKARDAERRAAEEANAATSRAVFWNEANEKATRKATAAIDEKIEAQEIEVAWMRGLGKETTDAELALMKLNAERLRAIPVGSAATAEAREELAARRANNIAMAESIEKRIRLTEVERKAAGTVITFDAAPKRGGGRRAAAPRGTTENDALFGRALGFGGVSNIEAESERRRFAAESGRVGAMQRDGSDSRGGMDAAAATDAQLRAIEVQRATSGESIALINAERDARLQLLQVQHDAATTGAERMMLQQEQEQVHHDATLRRIAEEQAAEERKLARRVALTDMTASLINSGVQLSAIAAKASGASAKKQEQIAQKTAGVQALAIGALEVVKAAAAYASLNIPQGVAHTAAAAVAFAQGGLLLSGAGSGGGGGGGAGASLGSVTQGPRGTAEAGSTSPIPGSPSPQAPSAAGGGGSSGGTTTIIDLKGAHLYGTPQRELIRAIRQGLDDDRDNRRPRRDS